MYNSRNATKHFFQSASMANNPNMRESVVIWLGVNPSFLNVGEIRFAPEFIRLSIGHSSFSGMDIFLRRKKSIFFEIYFILCMLFVYFLFTFLYTFTFFSIFPYKIPTAENLYARFCASKLGGCQLTCAYVGVYLTAATQLNFSLLLRRE